MWSEITRKGFLFALYIDRDPNTRNYRRASPRNAATFERPKHVDDRTQLLEETKEARVFFQRNIY